MKIAIRVFCVVLVFIALFLNSCGVFAADDQKCREYSLEQKAVLETAYLFGRDIGYGYTLAAIAQQESFLGYAVIRINPYDKDKRYMHQAVRPAGSYGITHVLLTTAMQLDGMDPYNPNDSLHALQYLTRTLQNDDAAALLYTTRKLEEVRRHYFGTGRPLNSKEWHMIWGGYNSYKDGKAYANSIAKIIKSFIRCKTMKPFDEKYNF